MAEIKLDPYIFFTGNCREAMEFYKEVFGGELTIQTLKEAGMGDSDNVMHAHLKGGLVELMASDGTRTKPYETSSISLSLSGSDTDTLTKVFEQLSDVGEVTAPLKKESWGDTFGTLTDRFGVDWMVNINAPTS